MILCWLVNLKCQHFKSYLRLVPVPGKYICSTGILGCHWLYQVVSLVAVTVLLSYKYSSYNIRVCDEGNKLMLIGSLISIGQFECCAETLQQLKSPSANTVTPEKGLDGSRLGGPRPAFITRCT